MDNNTAPCCVDLDQIMFVEQMKTVSAELADWAQQQFNAGRSLESVKAQFRRVMRVVTPLREASEPIGENVSRTETEMNFGWAEEVPELFVQSVKAFQEKTPITHWRHHIDLGRKGFITLIAVRRDQPFDSVQAYLADGGPFLAEIGMTR